MIDQWGRSIDYLRISVTDRCNLRCIYCMPEKDAKFMPREDLLTIDEIFRIVNLISELGVTKVRITGGEPLVREGIVDLIKSIKSLQSIKEVCLTTNGILLMDYLDKLVDAGLDRVNISLDTLKEDLFENITGGGDIKPVLKSIDECINRGIKVKLNTVIMKEYNDSEILDFVRLTEKNPIDVRFIEMMPIGAGKGFKPIGTDEIKDLILKNVKLNICEQGKEANGPAAYYMTEKGLGKIGFISPMSHSFCGSCNRIRLTSEGFLKQCLHWRKGENLRNLMRNGISDSNLKELIKESVYSKPYEHGFYKNDLNSDKRFMFQIGG